MSASRALSPSAQSFLSHLALPHEHNDISSFHHAELSYVGEGVFELPRSTFVTHAPPKIGPISSLELHDDSYIEWIRTAWTMTTPTLAMMELWLRFFALIVGPVCVGCLFAWELCGRRNAFVSNLRMTVAILAVASSAVVFTDSLYVYEYGREVGCYLFLVSSALTLRLVHRLQRVAKPSHAHDDKRNKDRRTQCKSNIFSILAWGLIAITAIVFMRSDGGHALKLHIETVPYLSSILSGHNLQVSDPGIDLPTIEPGFYHSSNPFIQSIAKHWPETSRSYNVSNGATPYLVNGDQRTGIPFLVNKVEEQEYVRVYVTNPYDHESIALDIAFPYSNGDSDEYHSLQESKPFVYHLDKPVYLILHGLNGGSHEEYVKDFVRRRRAEGSTVVVMIARGMMDTSMKGWNVFHGARTGDIDIAARAMRRGLDQISKAHGIQRQMLAGVGYSMGAIILSNYVARSGIHCALDSAVAVSGGLDMRQQLNFKRSMRLWQPMLTFGLRDDILLGKYARHYKHRLTKAQFMSMLRVSSISVCVHVWLSIDFLFLPIPDIYFAFLAS